MMRVVLALLAVQASFGGNAVITKVALGHNTDPVVFSFLRDVGGGSVLLLACRIFGVPVEPRRADLGTFIVLGVLGVYIGQMFLVMALQFVEPIHAAVMQPLQPVLTVLLAALCGVEPLLLRKLHGRLKLGGVLLAATGAVCTVYWASHVAAAAAADTGGAARHARRGLGHPPPPAAPTAPRLITGYALLTVQCVSGALYQLLQKHLLSTADYPPLAVAAIGYIVGAASIGLMLPVCKLDSAAWAFLADRTALGALAYAILMTSAFNCTQRLPTSSRPPCVPHQRTPCPCARRLVLSRCALVACWTVLADALQAFANKWSSPTLVTAFFPMQMVFTALFSWIFLGSAPRAGDYAGAAMIVSGLAAVTAGRVLHARQANKRRAGLDA